MKRLVIVLVMVAATGPARGADMAVERFAEGVPASARKILVDIYRDAGGRIAEAVIHPTGKTFNARQFNRARAAQLSRQIDAVLLDVKARTIRWGADNAAKAYRGGLETAVSQLRQAGLADSAIPVQGGFSQIDRRTVAVIAADIAISLDDALSDQAKSAKRFLTASAQRMVPDSEISKVVAAGAISGDVRATVRGMRGLLNEAEIEDYRKAGQQIIEVGKASMTVRAYAEMLVRTRMRQATEQGRKERLVANGHDLVSIVGSLSRNFCTAYLGRVFSITGGSTAYPPLASLPGGGPPFHPNCSKSTRAFIERFATDAQKRQAKMTDRRLVTGSASAAQAIFDRKDELRNVERRFKTIGAENI